MFPQTELDNYKLQVELLQEKLKRSEEQRKQLEEKFESIMRKRSEQEKMMKMKSKIKYQQFLEEQRERNERNKALIKLMERVDQQAAALAARSERLKMMKLQYELYFAKLLQVQNMRSIQNSPRHYPMMPLNHIVTNTNLPIGIQDICQSSSNLSKSSPTVPESWSMMPNNTSAGSSNLPYRFPGNVDYFNGQILLSQDPLQRQVNLKSTFGDSMASTHGYPAQIGTFADTRRNPIEFEHYKPPDLNMASAYMATASPLRTIRPDNHNRNLNETQSLGQMNNESDFNGKVEFNGYIQRQVDIQRPPYQMSTSDKSPNIKQDDTHERMVAEVNEDDNKTDAVEKHDEKSQPMNTVQRDITPMDEGKRKTDESKESWLSTEKSMKKVQDLFSPNNLLNNTNTINGDKPRTPVMWNFSGRIDPQDSSYPIQLGKKEKLTMENIENAIYGERISPLTRKKELALEILPKSPEKQIFMEKQDIKIEPVLKQSDAIKELENHEEKTDLSEKEEKGVEGEAPEITAQVESKPSTPVSETTATPPLEKPESHGPETKSQTNLTSETTSNQQYPEGYSQNYEESQQKSTAGENQSSSYSDLQYDESKPTEQQPAEYQSSPGKEYPQTAEGSQEPYASEQYQAQDYSYPDYTQNQEYADYQAGQYQGDYSQQPYDPNAYGYNYDQQDGGVYHQTDASYPQAEGSYQQPDGTYQQVPGSYQEGNEAYQRSGVYQQQDGSYQQGEGFYQDPSQQMYAGDDYNSQSYSGAMYPNQYNGTEYTNYEEQKSDQGNSDKQGLSTVSGPTSETQNEPTAPQENMSLQNTSQAQKDSAEENVILPMPPHPAVMPPSILATEKPVESNANKKKKKVNFVDSETEESSSAAAPPKPENPPQNNDESDFDFSSN